MDTFFFGIQTIQLLCDVEGFPLYIIDELLGSDKYNDPKLQKNSKLILSTKELKDELQKKADASKFGSLFSNITPVVDGDCS